MSTPANVAHRCADVTDEPVYDSDDQSVVLCRSCLVETVDYALDSTEGSIIMRFGESLFTPTPASTARRSTLRGASGVD